MKGNRVHRVVILVISCFFIYFFGSIFSSAFKWGYNSFDKVNIVFDIFLKSDSTKKVVDNNIYSPDSSIVTNPIIDFNLYKKGGVITNFHTGDSIVSLPSLAEKLAKLKQSGKGKIRIAYLGDSMIEGDLITQTLRKLLQKEFGGQGVGFLPMASDVAKFRQSARILSSGWSNVNFMTSKSKNLYLSGYNFFGRGEGTYTDNTFVDSRLMVQKSIIFGQGVGGDFLVNGIEENIVGEKLVNKKSLANDYSNVLKIKSNSDDIPIFGVSFESENGVFLDNFSFRGITGVEFNKLDEEFLKAIGEANPYDLIIIQYGVNLLFRPNDTDYSYYEKMMNPVLAKIKRALPMSEYLLISTADRAFRYDGEYRTAIGLSNLLEIQAKLAFNNNMSFYNQFASMGGENSIVNWATQKPPLANKDYIHPNFKGAEVLGKNIYEALIKDYKKYR